MNTTMYTSADYCDSTEQIVVETQMIWTQVNV